MTDKPKTYLVTDDEMIQDHLDALRGQIEEQGYTMMSVFADPQTGTPDFTYTLGLQAKTGQPDLIVFGVPPHGAQAMLAALVDRSRHGAPLADRQRVEGVAAVPLLARTADERCEAFVSERMNDVDPVYLQIVWSDPAGLFPWDTGFDEAFRDSQPLLFDVSDVDLQTPPVPPTVH